MAGCFIGLMSGTSLDAIDGALVGCGDGSGAPAVRATASVALEDALRQDLLALNQPGGQNELHRAALAANRMAHLSAEVVQRLLQQAGLQRSDVRAIGSHGQTVRHQPGRHDGVGYTVQINQPALLAELTGITVVADFRSRDLAAGGQGAPLAPAFHQALFGQPDQALAVLNLGGMANLSVLEPGRAPRGFDTGPGNVLLDLWIRRHLQQPCDIGGRWAVSGRPDPALLADCLADPYFSASPPKSTGRDHFNAAWLDARIRRVPQLAPADVQATLSLLTARSVADALRSWCAGVRVLLVCGGGACNQHLMALLAAELPGLAVRSTETAGIAPQWVEAAGFAWLARLAVERRPIDLTRTTGARAPRVLGAIWHA